jgi:hypothetical protein
MTQFGTNLVRSAVAMALGAGSLLIFTPGRAAACSPNPCRRGYFLPRDGGEIPANTTTLAWKMSGIWGDGGVQELRLTRLDDPSSEVPSWTLEEQADGSYWIKLAAELAPGGRYRLRADGDCSDMAAEFEVTEAADVPETLGELELTPVAAGSVEVGTVSGSCSIGVQAMHAELLHRLSAEAAPWADLLAYDTIVDGEPYRPRTRVLAEATPDLASIVFAECPDRYPPGEMRDDGAYDTDLPEGEHTVRVAARLPGAEAAIVSDAARVTLECSAWDAAAQEPSDSHGDANGAEHDNDDEHAAGGQKSSADCSLRAPSPSSGTRAEWWLALACACLAARRASLRPQGRQRAGRRPAAPEAAAPSSAASRRAGYPPAGY